MTIQHAAAIWCNIPKNEIDEHLKMCRTLNETSEYGKSIFIHPFISCLEFRCKLIQEAIEESKLKVGRDGGKGNFQSEIGHVAYSRRTINREDLKEWIKKEFPNDMPATLFDELERNTHQAIGKDAYLALKADRDKQKNDVQRLEGLLQAINVEKESKISENEHLKRLIDSLATPKNTNIQDTNLIVIGAMIESIKERNKQLGKPTAGIQKQLIGYMLDTYPNVMGISESNLSKIFADANKYIKQVVD